MNKFFKNLGYIFIILLGICLWIGLIVAIPIAAIWSVNTLIGLGIAYTFLNWLAVHILITLFGAGPLIRAIHAHNK